MESNLTLRIANRLDELSGLEARVSEFLERKLAPADVIHRVNLVIEELGANIIRWGFDDDARHEILVRIDAEPSQVRLEMEDEGRPFDPLSLPPFDPASPVADRREGGLGVHLVRNLVDEFRYERRGTRNVVRAQLALRPA